MEKIFVNNSLNLPTISSAPFNGTANASVIEGRLPGFNPGDSILATANEPMALMGLLAGKMKGSTVTTIDIATQKDGTAPITEIFADFWWALRAPCGL